MVVRARGAETAHELRERREARARGLGREERAGGRRQGDGGPKDEAIRSRDHSPSLMPAVLPPRPRDWRPAHRSIIHGGPSLTAGDRRGRFLQATGHSQLSLRMAAPPCGASVDFESRGRCWWPGVGRAALSRGDGAISVGRLGSGLFLRRRRWQRKRVLLVSPIILLVLPIR